MKLKLLAGLALVGLCAGSQALAANGMKTLADDAPSSSQPPLGNPDNAGSSTDNSTSGTDNSGTQDSSMPPSSDDTSTDTGTGDDDY